MRLQPARQPWRPDRPLHTCDPAAPAPARARRGEYSRARNIPASLRARYCRPSESGRLVVAECIRQRAGFSRLNLLAQQNAVVGEFDPIYCQNVSIYFDQETRGRVLATLTARLRPEGVLVPGAGEVDAWSSSALQRVGGKQLLAFCRRIN